MRAQGAAVSELPTITKAEGSLYSRAALVLTADADKNATPNDVRISCAARLATRRFGDSERIRERGRRSQFNGEPSW